MESRGNTVRNGLLTILFLSASLITPCSKPCGFCCMASVRKADLLFPSGGLSAQNDLTQNLPSRLGPRILNTWNSTPD